MRILLVILVLGLAVACDEPEGDKIPLSTTKIELEKNSRFSVSRIAIFDDDIAYNNVRGIYILKDKQTGKEYVGVSGIGISELGDHHAGKATVSDER